jgi:hypothetical protein
MEGVNFLNWEIRPECYSSTAVENVTERVEILDAFRALVGNASAGCILASGGENVQVFPRRTTCRPCCIVTKQHEPTTLIRM